MNTGWKGKRARRNICRVCFESARREYKRQRYKKVGRARTVRRNNSYEKVTPDILYDYRFAVDVLKLEEEDAYLWLARGYRISHSRLITWPIKYDAYFVKSIYPRL